MFNGVKNMSTSDCLIVFGPLLALVAVMFIGFTVAPIEENM